MTAILLSMGLVVLTPAVASASEPDGCTAVPDSGRTFDFHEACDDHDRCYIDQPYGDSSGDRRRCDREFHGAMKDSCDDLWPSRADRHARSVCKGVAWLYYVGVRTFGGLAWDNNDDPALAA